jgi:uncharacterized protein
MIKLQKLQIRTNDNYLIDSDLRISDEISDSQLKPLLIFTHGFKGFKDWGGFPYMMEKLASSGFISVSFNFTFNGVSNEQPTEFTRLDLFEKNTFSRELKECGIVINHLIGKKEKYYFDTNNIFLIGHSRGGGITILESAKNNLIRGLVTLASVSNFHNRYTDDQKKRWREDGYLDVPNSRTGQMMRMNTEILDDIENNFDRLNIIGAVKKIKKPFLIVHGKEDQSVKVKEALEIYENADKKYSKILLIENTGHTFGVEHPFNGTTNAFEKVIEKMIDFIKNNLN